jgi:Tfp pilus assembly protein PilF
MLYFQKKEFGKAEECFRKAISIDPDNLRVYNLLGRLYWAQNSVSRAIEEYQNMLNKDPRSTQARTMLGIIFETQKNYQQAKMYYEEALQINPHLPVPANNLAWILADGGGDLNQALSLAQIARQKMPDSPNINDTLGWVYYKRNDQLLAISSFKKAIVIDPNNPIFHYHLGLAYAKSGEKANAIYSLNKALSLKANFAGAEDARKTLAGL